MALALGVSVAVATDPSITYQQNGANSSEISLPEGSSWSSKDVQNNGSSNSFYQLQNSSTPIENITLQFDGATSAPAISGNTLTIKQLGVVTATSDTILSLTSEKGLYLGNTGTGTLKFDFQPSSSSSWGNANHSRNMVLDLSDAVGISIQGNLTINGGRAQAYYGENKFEGRFGGDIVGNVTLSGADRVSTLNFVNGNAKIQGNLNLSSSVASSTTAISGLSTITGNINASGYATVTFDSNTQVNGDITTDGTYNSYLVTLKGLGSVNNITTRGDSLKGKTRETNTIFGTDAKVYGNICANNIGINRLVFTQNSTLQTADGGSIEIVGRNTGSAGLGAISKNILIFNGSTTSKISSLLVSGDTAYGATPEGTFNALSYNGANSNTEITSVSASYMGYNLIGKDLFTYSSDTITYNSDMFSSNNLKEQIKSTALSEFIKDTHSANGTFTFGSSNTSNAMSAGLNGRNYVNINGETTIQGNIVSNKSSASNPTSGLANVLVLTGTSATLGSDSNAISIKIENSTGRNLAISSINTLLFGATKNTLNLSELSVVSNWALGSGGANQNFNALSFNSSTNTLNLTTMNATYGANIIGKDLITQDAGFNTTLFGTENVPVIQDGFISEFVKTSHSAIGTFTFGSDSGDVADAIKMIGVKGEDYEGAGANYININGTTTINGNIVASSGGVGNVIALSGTSATLGATSRTISITSRAANITQDVAVSNTLLFNANTNILNLSSLSVTGKNIVSNSINRYFNALSFNQDSSSANTLDVASMDATYGSNIIGRDLITQDAGYDTTLFGNANSQTIQSGFASEFVNASYTANGTFTFGTITANGAGANYINVENASISGNISASSNGKNIIIINGNTSTIGSGSISANGSNAVNKMEILQGETNVTNLAMSASSSGQNTLVVNALAKSSIITSMSISGDGNAQNNITIKNSDLTIASGVSTSGNWNSNGQNNINLQKDNAALTISSGGITTKKANYEYNRDNTQKNNITFSNGGILSLTGDISAQHGNQNNFTFNGTNNATITISSGSIQASNEGKNNFIFSGSVNTINNSMTKESGGQNNITLTSDNSTLTLQGETNQISTFTALSGATTGDTLTLDTTTNTSVVANVNTLVNGGNLKVIFGGDTSKTTQLTLNTANATALKSVSVRGGTNNTLVLSGTGTTAISEKVTIDANQGIIFGLAGGASLTFSQDLETKASGSTTFNLGGINTITGTLTNNGTHNFFVKDNATLKYNNGLSFSSGTNNITFDTANKSLSWQNANGEGKDITTSGGATTINFSSDNGVLNAGVNTTAGTSLITIADSKSGTITGNINGTNSVVFGGGTAKLTLQGSSNALSLVDTTSAGTLSLNPSNASTTTIAQLKGNNLTANFGGTDKSTKLVITDSDDSSKTITLAGVTLEPSSTNNTLDLTSLTSVTISSAVSVDSGKGLTIALGSTDMIFTNGLSDNSVLSVNGASSFTTTTGDIEANTLNLVGDGSSKATFKNATTTLSTLNANAKGGNTLALGESGGNTYTLTIGSTNANLTELSLNGASATININGGTQSLQTLSTNATTTNALNLSGTKTTISSSLNADGSKTLNLTLTDSTLSLGGESNKISSLVASGKTLVDLARVDSEGNALTRAGRAMKTLEIGANSGSGFKGDATFEVYVGGGQADNVVFTQVQTKDGGGKSNATLVASGNLYSVLNGGGTLLASVANTQTTNLEVTGGERLIGGVVVKTDLESKEENGTTNYYLKQGEDLGAPIQYQEVASSALTVNYDLFLANFNSLNKRMGELRDDANSNGVWARVFGGAMSNDFGAGSKTEYITAQAGYDYALSVGNNARNHLGIAVAYGTSNTQGNTLSMNGLLGASGSISLNEVDSHMVEVGIYNTFISDSGWYNDTILKFDYIMSKFSLSNKTDLFTDTSNFAMVLSDEFGYRYKFGENEKGSWYIDPQLEMAFGYFNQSDFNRAMYDTAGLYQSTMQATQDTILTLRTRVGASLGKKFNTEKGFASLYVGAFYEYDYINGGNASVQGRAGGTTTSLDSIESNGRAMLNIGSNIELTKGARLYIDVEKSFGDKQRTFMQFNLGARYSF